jgi:hypothetical protein
MAQQPKRPIFIRLARPLFSTPPTAGEVFHHKGFLSSGEGPTGFSTYNLLLSKCTEVEGQSCMPMKPTSHSILCDMVNQVYLKNNQEYGSATLSLINQQSAHTKEIPVTNCDHL